MPAVTDAPRQEFSERGPMEIANFLDEKRLELADLQVDLEKAHNDAEEAEIAWMDHFDDVMEDLEGDGEKLPGEEKCVGMARRRGGWDLWIAFRKSERQVKQLEKKATLIANQLSAAQSEGKLLRDEVQ